MKKLLLLITGLLLLFSVEGQILRYSNYTASNQSTNLVYNGTFDSADGWNTAGTMTITGGQLVWSSSSPYGTCIQNAKLATSTSYNLSFTIVSYSGGSNAFVAFSNSNNTVTYVAMSGYSVGNHTVSFTTPGTLDPTGIRILINNEESNTQVVFDNISIVAQ
ncbi:MAG TPA: hypothetical protein PLX62_06800 [Bacteroidales bacterium]|nr:hypothetical protein [Bacteroidales bacterium]